MHTAEYSITRKLAAEPQRVYRAWTTPAGFSRWFGPREFTMPEDRIVMQTRPGGAWQVVMLDDAGNEHALGGVYRELDAPARLVMTTGHPDDTTSGTASTVSVMFKPTGDGGTEMTMRQQGLTTDAARAEDAVAGWRQFFDRLAEHLGQR
ncbi:SRPBCC domain-containing protein [Dactylosporangium siamense]|uniref:SRPBCC family protein n=1 Tax=Dactylosporangium siamense TaxID=685454 RepID=UPI0019453E2E|nr:SRPBCC domain-containing protein [Dactylosporangium siamense]